MVKLKRAISAQRVDPHIMGDLFVQDIIDYAPKDDRTMMERPFFSIAKRKRNKPIEYESDDGQFWIKVRAHPEFGMATIWDADIMIWLISKIVAEKDRGRNLESATIHTTPYEILKGIARGTSGTEYRRLLEAMQRLRHTSIETNIRAPKTKFANFNWLAEFEGEGSLESPEQMEKVRTIALTLPSWIFRAISNSSNVLTLDREYFLLSGGLERALYRIARKHAGNQPQGWVCSIPVLQKKTGSDSSMKKFAEMLKKIVKADKLPRYKMTLTQLQDGTAAVHFVDRSLEAAAKAHERIQAELAHIERLGREDARMSEVDRLHRTAG